MKPEIVKDEILANMKVVDLAAIMAHASYHEDFADGCETRVAQLRKMAGKEFADGNDKEAKALRDLAVSFESEARYRRELYQKQHHTRYVDALEELKGRDNEG